MPKFFNDPKSLAQRPKESKKKYEKAFGKSTDNPEDKDDRVLPLQSQNQKIETSKSFPSDKDSANEEFQSSFDENSKEIIKIDEGLHFTCKNMSEVLETFIELFPSSTISTVVWENQEGNCW